MLPLVGSMSYCARGGLGREWGLGAVREVREFREIREFREDRP